MATNPLTVETIEGQLATLAGVRTRKMFGEYALYLDDKLVALICDDRLFLKMTEPGLRFIDDPMGEPPYPGAKNYLPVPREKWADAEWMGRLVRETADALPVPKPKKPKVKKPAAK